MGHGVDAVARAHRARVDARAGRRLERPSTLGRADGEHRALHVREPGALAGETCCAPRRGVRGGVRRAVSLVLETGARHGALRAAAGGRDESERRQGAFQSVRSDAGRRARAAHRRREEGSPHPAHAPARAQAAHGEYRMAGLSPARGDERVRAERRALAARRQPRDVERRGESAAGDGADDNREPESGAARGVGREVPRRVAEARPPLARGVHLAR